MNFSEWITSELNRHGWSRREAARRGGFSPSILDKVINGYSNPGIKFLRGISVAFKIPLATVIAAATEDINPLIAPNAIPKLISEIVENYKRPETQNRALEYIEFLRIQEEQGSYEIYPTPNPEPKWKQDHNSEESLKKALRT